MNLFQRIAALFGAEYVAQVYKDSAYVRRVVRLGKYWVLKYGNTRIAPAGRIHGSGATWEPLTKKAKHYFNSKVC